MKLSLIIPAHNEEGVISRTLTSVSKTLRKHKLDFEIIAVDDNSDDNTFLIMKKLARQDKRLKPVHKGSKTPGPTGLGSAIIFGFKRAKGDVLIPFMGDLSDDPEDILKMIKKIEQGYDVVGASRFVKGGKMSNYPLTKLVINRMWNNVFGFLFGLGVKDISNAFKAYRREVIETVKPKSKGFEMTAELALKAHMEGFKFSEVPCSWRSRGKGEGESKFGSFSISYIFTKVPKVGYAYGTTALKLWFEMLSKKISSIIA